MTNHPYAKLPPQAFWRSAISELHCAEMTALWDPMPLTRSDRIATAGSCFAQHIGRNLAQRGANFMDLEPPPPGLLPSLAEERRFGYRVYSCRYGNVYTARQLLQLFDEAFGQRKPADVVWSKGSRHFDALRPGVDPVGQSSAETVLALRQRHLAAVREMFTTLDVFVFTLGLTEAWVSTGDGTAYPTAPGTLCGEYAPARHVFHNFRYPEIHADLEAFWAGLRQVNPGARMLLTVSPVPLTATASGEHVLVATAYSKSVLRAVAGDLAHQHADIHYFPSYEIIAGHPARAMFYDPNLRTVNPFGVQFVMSHFFSGKLAEAFATLAENRSAETPELVCDEEALDKP